MAYSLEARSPLLDHELMELAASIPPRQGARRPAQDRPRGALRGWVPEAILDGRKQGFELPVARWLRSDLAPFARESSSIGRAAAALGRTAGVEAMLAEHQAGSVDHGRRLWALLTLELWAQSAMPTARSGRPVASLEEPAAADVLTPCGRPA